MAVRMVGLVGREVAGVDLSPVAVPGRAAAPGGWSSWTIRECAAERRRESSIGSRSLLRRSAATASWSYDATAGRSSSMQRWTRSAKISAASVTWPMISRAVHWSNFVVRRRSAGTVRTIRATVDASSASQNALSSSYRSRSKSFPSTTWWPTAGRNGRDRAWPQCRHDRTPPPRARARRRATPSLPTPRTGRNRRPSAGPPRE